VSPPCRKMILYLRMFSSPPVWLITFMFYFCIRGFIVITVNIRNIVIIPVIRKNWLICVSYALELENHLLLWGHHPKHQQPLVLHVLQQGSCQVGHQIAVGQVPPPSHTCKYYCGCSVRIVLWLPLEYWHESEQSLSRVRAE
jgi:hypothetical protein